MSEKLDFAGVIRLLVLEEVIILPVTIIGLLKVPGLLTNWNYPRCESVA